VLYERLAAARRVRLHRRIGEIEESAYGARVQEHAAELALHFERGHDHRRALRHLELAARNAAGKHAHHEAAALLGRALDILPHLPDATEAARAELPLRMALGTSLFMTRGYAAPAVEHAFARARELSRHMDGSPELVFALAGLFRFFFSRAKVQLAREVADQVLHLAEAHDRSLLAVGHSLVGLPLLSLGEFAMAREHLEQAIALYDMEQHRSIATQHGDDPALTALAFLAIGLWFLGYPDQALERSREGDALAIKLGAPYSIAFVRSFSTWVHVRRGEPAQARARSEALIGLAAEQGFTFFVDEASIFRGWAIAEQGEPEAGIEQIRQGLAAHRAAGVEMGRPSHLALLAEAYARAGRFDEGLGVIEEAIVIVADTGERSNEADLYRLRGDLLCQQAGQKGRKAAIDARAEQSLEQAIAIARRQGARAFELRAALTLYRLRQGRRGHAQARRLLGELYGGFTEGFDTADLKAARALLDGP
jgi:predicted ATPase